MKRIVIIGAGIVGLAIAENYQSMDIEKLLLLKRNQILQLINHPGTVG